jgi:hypothetical protein
VNVSNPSLNLTLVVLCAYNESSSSITTSTIAPIGSFDKPHVSKSVKKISLSELYLSISKKHTSTPSFIVKLNNVMSTLSSYIIPFKLYTVDGLNDSLLFITLN